jgi:DNA-binding NtrC family response regulator
VDAAQHRSDTRPALELVVLTDDTTSVAVLPGHGSVTLGRGEDCDIRIDSRSVSRRHAILHVGPALRIQDLGSANGTFVRDARVSTETAGTHPLRRLSRESLDVAIGERINLGAISIVVRRTRSGDAGPGSAVVRDPAMVELYEQVARAARSEISVLVLGETGVGKEMLARAVHDRSPRARGPFLELNCAALPPSLLESELFGHEKNAFTGAQQARPGLLEAANHGTIFLDEVGELPQAVQVKLLRVLEDRKVLRVGGRTPHKLDVRFVAATNRDLEAEVARGAFRQDLYYRLNGVAFVIPPLRDRVSEIAVLAERFLAQTSQTLDRDAPLRLSPEAVDYLERHAWPGNVRELRNTIERAAIFATGNVVVPSDLSSRITRPARDPSDSTTPVAIRAPAATPAPAAPRASTDGDAARQRIVEALEQCAGNQTRAAKLLGISLRTLVNRLGKYDVARPRKRT